MREEKKVWKTGTISSTTLWKSYCPGGVAEELALTVDTNLENTRKHEFVWADPSMVMSLHLETLSFSPDRGRVRDAGSAASSPTMGILYC